MSFDYAIDNRKLESGAFTNLFSGKERIKDLTAEIFSYSCAGICYRNTGMFSGTPVTVSLYEVVIQFDLTVQPSCSSYHEVAIIPEPSIRNPVAAIRVIHIPLKYPQL